MDNENWDSIPPIDLSHLMSSAIDLNESWILFLNKNEDSDKLEYISKLVLYYLKDLSQRTRIDQEPIFKSSVYKQRLNFSLVSK